MTEVRHHEPGAGPARSVALPGALRASLLALLAALPVLVVALLLAGGAEGAPVNGLPDPGALTRWGLPLSTMGINVSAAVAVGALLVAVLAPADGSGGGRTDEGALSAATRRCLRVAAGSGGAWALMALTSAVLTTSDIAGMPVERMLRTGNPLAFSALLPVRALLEMTLVAALVGVCARSTRTQLGAALVLTAALAGLVPPTLAGHSTHASNHSLATGGLVVHVIAATLWVGGLIGLALVLRRPEPRTLAAVVPRFSRLALGCYLAVATSGLVLAYIRVRTPENLVGSDYGTLVLLKAAALLGLGVLGWWHRRRTVPAVVARLPTSFLRLASAELVLMGVAMALAVALSRTATP